MPFYTMRSDMCHAPDRFPNNAIVDEFADCLPAPAKKSVGSISNHQSLGGGKIEDALPVLKSSRERLFE